MAAFREQLDAGYYAVVSTGEGHAEQVRELPRRRRARDPAPADRRRVSGAGVLPETARGLLAAARRRAPAARARPHVDADDGRAHGAVPRHRGAAGRARAAAAPVAAVVASPTPGRSPSSTPRRGANVLEPKPRAGDGRRAGALGLLGDLVGHDARELHARTGPRDRARARSACGWWARRARCSWRRAAGASGASACACRTPSCPRATASRTCCWRCARTRRLRHRGQPGLQRRALARAPAPARARCGPRWTRRARLTAAPGG